MRILVFHGYLLRGTGSNVYNANLASALVRLGHEVHLLSQERAPQDLPFVDAVGDWDEGTLNVRTLREPVRCTAYRPRLHGLLPVYVADRYEGIEARPFPSLSEEEVDRYVAANVAAVEEVAAAAPPEVALANHLVMGPVVLARGLGPAGVPYAVKIHGSALEYTVKPHPDRFLPYAREGLAPARGVLVGSRHTAESLWRALEDPSLPPRTRLGPPGVDVHAFGPREPPAARAGLAALVDRLRAAHVQPGGEESSFAADPAAAAAALERLDPDADRLVAYVGKLLVSKGVDLLAAAWPLVVREVPAARLVVVGFGAYRAGLERLLGALAAGDLAAARELAREGREQEGGPAGELRHLAGFLDGLEGAEREEYLAAAATLPGRVVLTGRLEHAELADLLPAAEALVVPSTFPEAFGMVAAEAAGCGALPVSAGHSGLAEVARTLAEAVPEEVGPLLTFPLEGDPVRALADRVVRWLRAPEEVRARAREALVAVVRERYSWEGVAGGVVAAGRGELDGLLSP